MGIVLLFIGTCIIPAIAQDIEKTSQPTSSGNWLYVGGDGPGNYTKIQDAIDNASDGDTVFVFSGIYYENIVINTSIVLIGEMRDTTIIDGGNDDKSDTVWISAPGVSITHFTIQNSGHEQHGPYGPNAGIDIYTDNNIVSENRIINNLWGVHLFTANNNIISHNIISDNDKDGISLYDWVSYNIITNNTIFRNYDDGVGGGGFFKGFHNEISRNYITFNYDGVYIARGEQYIICNNTIEYNENHGVYILFSFEPHIVNNIISYNGCGIELGYEECIGSYISRNVITHNYYGIWSVLSSKNNISYNEIADNVGIGLFLYGSENNIVSRNNFINNSKSAGFIIYEKINKSIWIENYWSDSIFHLFFPKFIFGMFWWIINEDLFFPFPWVQLDRHPAQEPYDIPGLT